MERHHDREHVWDARVRTLGFREAAVASLRDRLRQEEGIKRVVSLIRRLRKYDPARTVVKVLYENPTWRPRVEALTCDVPKVTLDPRVGFVSRTEGNVPNVPAMGENRIYFGSGETFYALDGDTGKTVWSRRSPGTTWSTAWYSHKALYVAFGGRLYALSSSDGAERWCFEVEKRLVSPYVCHDTVFVGSEEGTLYALNATTGTRLWTFNVAGKVFVGPGLWQGTVYAASRDRSVYAIRIEDGECLWRFTTDGEIRAVPRVWGGIVYVTSTDREIRALHAVSGRLLWSFATGGEVDTSVFEEGGVVFATSRDKHLYFLRAGDGKELWRYRMLGYPSSPRATGGMVYLSAQGRVYGFSAADRKMCWCFPLGHSVSTAPAVCDDRIYVGTREGQLFGLKLNAELGESGARRVIGRFLGAQSQDTGEREEPV